jgi:hypothetical protein
MAAGDITRDTGFPRQLGNVWVLTGTIEVDDTKRVYALCGTGCYLYDCFVVEEDGVGVAQVRVNEDASGTATNGSIAVMGNHQSVETYRYRATFLM